MSQNPELVELFTQLMNKLDMVGDLKTQIGIIAGQVGILAENQTKLNHVVLGNGKPGHNERLREVEHQIEELMEWQKGTLEAQKKAADNAAEDRKQRERELRAMRNTLMVSIFMLIISTLVNIFLR